MTPMTENPNNYWCLSCGRSREHAEQHCSSADCRERRDHEDLGPEPDYSHLNLWRPA